VGTVAAFLAIGSLVIGAILYRKKKYCFKPKIVSLRSETSAERESRTKFLINPTPSSDQNRETSLNNDEKSKTEKSKSEKSRTEKLRTEKSKADRSSERRPKGAMKRENTKRERLDLGKKSETLSIETMWNLKFAESEGSLVFFPVYSAF
jgi:hypothetical protein